MKRTLCIITFMSFAAIFINPLSARAEEEANTAALKLEAANIVKKFSGTLKPRLKAAIQSGGLSHAISICSKEAPRIAEQLSRETGWTIKRVSLQPRNSTIAIADPFERKVLEKFNEREGKGEPVEAIFYGEISGSQFRFMKAQAVEGICLNCHGKEISAEVLTALKKHYPHDMATGYALGQIRGAFSLTKDLK